MKMSHLFFGWLVLGGVVLAQDSPQHPNAPTTGTNLAGEVQALREALSQTQKQLAAEQQEIETLKAHLKTESANSGSSELPPIQSAEEPMMPSRPGSDRSLPMQSQTWNSTPVRKKVKPNGTPTAGGLVSI